MTERPLGRTVDSVRITRALLWTVGLAAAAVTVLHALDPHGPVVHGAVATASVVETAVSCAAILLAALFFGRWQQRGLLLDLMTCFSLSVLAAGKLAFTVLPLAQTGDVQLHVRVAALLCGVVAAALLAVAALAPDRTSRWPRSTQLAALIAGVVATIAVIWIVAVAVSGSFTDLPNLPSTDALSDSRVSGVTIVQILSALGFGIASAGFARRERLTGDAFYGWLAVTVLLWALARVNYAFTPATLVNDLTVGDWLRLAGYGVGVVAASYEFTSYWRRLAGVAVLDERRRLARDMHDGLAQELAFIATQARVLGRDVTDERVEMLARAAERALDESRRGIAALTRAWDEPLDVALTQQAEELSARLGVRVLLELQPVPNVSAETREALLRIAREAISNAGRHGNASHISVHLSNHDGVSLQVTDDGDGFLVDDPSVYAGGRYGVVGMRERAEALGGSLRLTSQPSKGTAVEVWVP